MAVQKGAKKASKPGNDAIEERLVAFAEQLGTLVGTVQGRATGWLDREAIGKEVGRIRDSAADLLDYVNASVTNATTPATPKQAGASAKRQGRGPVDAPGKRHRQPPPQERGNPRMSQAKGTQTAPKLVKAGRRGGRG